MSIAPFRAPSRDSIALDFDYGASGAVCTAIHVGDRMTPVSLGPPGLSLAYVEAILDAMLWLNRGEATNEAIARAIMDLARTEFEIHDGNGIGDRGTWLAQHQRICLALFPNLDLGSL